MIQRLPGNSLTMTQELIANMLGVRREGVTEAAGNLQRAGLIRYSRGRIAVPMYSKSLMLAILSGAVPVYLLSIVSAGTGTILMVNGFLMLFRIPFLH